MDNKYRVGWLDISKGIGIILVVYGHVVHEFTKNASLDLNNFLFWSERVVYSFHMPLFFFLSGCLLRKQIVGKTFHTIILKKISTLLYPYVAWSILQGFIEVAVSSRTGTHVQISDVLALFWAPRAHFWFIYVLFYMSILTTLFHNTTGRLSPIIQYLICLFLFIIPVPLAGFSVFYIYFVVGFSLSTQIINWSKLTTVKKVICLVPLLLLCDYFLLTNFDYTYKLQYLTAPIGLLVVIILANFISPASLKRGHLHFFSNGLAYLGKYSLIIYLTHVLVYKAFFIVIGLTGIKTLWILLVGATVLGFLVPCIMYTIASPLNIGILFNGSDLLLLFKRFYLKISSSQT